MRDRLIEILKKFCTDDCKITHQCGYCDFGDLTVCPSAVAEHLLANGVIVPPCKVGDTVYVLFGEPSHTIKEFRVRTIVFGETHDSIGFTNKSLFTIWDKQWYDYFGKTVFLTREEAEQAIKEKE